MRLAIWANGRDSERRQPVMRAAIYKKFRWSAWIALTWLGLGPGGSLGHAGDLIVDVAAQDHEPGLVEVDRPVLSAFVKRQLESLRG